MDFQLKTLSTAQAATEKCDALIVLAASGNSPSKDPIATLVAEARKAGDLGDKAGKLLALYRPQRVAAPRVLLASVGDGKPASVRAAVVAAVAVAKAADPKKVAIVFAQPSDAASLRSAVIAAADASYVYTATKSKPEPVSYTHLTLPTKRIV